MRKRKSAVHLPSLLAGILIGALALIILFIALPTPKAGAKTASPSPVTSLQARFNKVVAQAREAWNQVLSGTKKSPGPTSSTNQTCQRVRTWFNQLDDRVVNYLNQHGVQIARWQIPARLCTSIPSKSG